MPGPVASGTHCIYIYIISPTVFFSEMCNVKTFFSIPLICIQQFGEFLARYLTKSFSENFMIFRTEESNHSVHLLKITGKNILSDLVSR